MSGVPKDNSNANCHQVWTNKPIFSTHGFEVTNSPMHADTNFTVYVNNKQTNKNTGDHATNQ